MNARSIMRRKHIVQAGRTGARRLLRACGAVALSIILVLSGALNPIGQGIRRAWADGAFNGKADVVITNKDEAWDGAVAQCKATIHLPNGTTVTAQGHCISGDAYAVPYDGTYDYTATPLGNNSYSVTIWTHTSPPWNAGSFVPGSMKGTQDMGGITITYNPDVTVSFTKVSANTSLTDGNSEYSLEGAAYDIHDASTDGKVASIVFDAQGHASCKLKPGKRYYAVETKAPKGFTLNTERIEFSTEDDGGSVELSDTPGHVTVVIEKKDAAGEAVQAGATLAGAEFKLVDANGEAHTAKTDAQGVARFGDDGSIPLGTVTITETKAPSGYKLDAASRTYTATSEQMDASGVVALEPQDAFLESILAFDIDIVKYKDSGDEGSGLQQAAAGVRFNIISNSSGKVAGTLTTDETGHASTRDAATVNEEATRADKTYDSTKPWFGCGKRNESIRGALPYDAKGYTVHEDPASTPEGYQPAPDWHISADQMADGATLHYIVDNDFVGSRIQVVKTDATSGQAVPLAGFTFQLLDADKQPVTQEVWYPNHERIDSFTTDDTGCVTFPEELKPETYYVRETSASAPYILNGEDIEVTISDSSSTEPLTLIKVPNAQAHGIASIKKTCSGDDCPWCDGDGGLAGAEFDVVAVEDIVSPDGAMQAACGTVVDHVTTGEDGCAKTSALPLGDGSAAYAFVETKAPAGHMLDATPIEFTLSWKDSKTEAVYAEAAAEDAPTETVLNKTVMNADTPLPGASFSLWPSFLASYDKEVANGKGAVALQLGDDGTDGVELTLAQAFDYAELAVDVPATYTVSVKDAKGRNIYTGTDAVSVMPGTYTIGISDSDGKPIDLEGGNKVELEAGKTCKLSCTEGIFGWGEHACIDISDMDAASYTEADFEADGDVLAIEGIEPGSYDLTVQDLNGNEPLHLEVSAGDWAYAAATADGHLIETSHMLLPHMQSVLDKTLSRLGVILTTGEDGAIDIWHLPASKADLIALMKRTCKESGDNAVEGEFEGIGTEGSIAWCIQETEAPDGFLTDSEIRSFTVHDDGSTEGQAVYTIPVEDDYTKVEISKRDIASEAEIEGAELTVTDGKGNVVDSWTSTTEPHRIDALAPGDYTLTEKMTPNTYDQAESVDFTVTASGKVQTVTMYDEPIKVSGQIDKRQEIADPTAKNVVENGDLRNKANVTVSDEGFYDYSIDYRSTSSTWVDEFTVEDTLNAAIDGNANLVGITTAQGAEDHDGKMNVWYKTDQTPADYMDDSAANATRSDGHENPWLADESNAERLGDDGRNIDYAGWHLWQEGVSTTQATELSVADLPLTEDEHVIGIRFEYGRVEEGFTTRKDGWDRDDLKDSHDDLDDVLDDAHNQGEAYAPAVIHMQVTDSYREGTRLDNAAEVHLYRNGGGEDLEDHDGDFVTQTPGLAAAVKNLDQTGGDPLAAACAFVAVAAVAGGVRAYRTHTLRACGEGRTAAPRRDFGRRLKERLHRKQHR